MLHRLLSIAPSTHALDLKSVDIINYTNSVLFNGSGNPPQYSKFVGAIEQLTREIDEN